MTHKSSLHRARRYFSFTLIPSFFRENSRLSRRESPRYLSNGSGTGESCHGHFER